MAKESVSNIAALTSARGVAAWWVVAYHFREYVPLGRFEFVRTVFAQGYLAVDLFFILSGFVIFLNYADSFSQLDLKAVRRFLALRLARIYPLHFVMLVAFLINPIAIALFSHGGTIGERFDASYFILSLLLLHDWGFVDYLAWNVPSWSISAEWFAYLCFPLVAHLAARRPLRVDLAVGLIVLPIALLGWLFWMSGATFIGDRITSLGVVRCVLEFAAGCFICVLYRRYSFTAPTWSYFFLLGALVVIVASNEVNIANYFTIPASFCLIIIGLAAPNPALDRVFRLRPLLFLGEISYSTYMVHYFIKDWVKFLLVKTDSPELLPTVVYVLATLAASAILYRTVEVPGRHLVVARLIPKAL